MISMGVEIIVEGDKCWPDLAGGDYTEGRWSALALLPQGTASGRSTVTARIELPDGSTVLAQTTLRLLENALRAFLEAELRAAPKGYP